MKTRDVYVVRRFDDRELGEMGKHELLDLKEQLDSDINEIKTQIEKARTERRVSGVFADREWYQRASEALRIKGLESQRVQRRLSALRARRAADSEADNERRRPLFQDAFIRVTKQRVTAEVFDEICAEAGRIVDAEIEKTRGK